MWTEIHDSSTKYLLLDRKCLDSKLNELVMCGETTQTSVPMSSQNDTKAHCPPKWVQTASNNSNTTAHKQSFHKTMSKATFQFCKHYLFKTRAKYRKILYT